MDRPPAPAALDDADLAAAAPSALVRTASGFVMAGGLATALVGVQNLVGYEVTGTFFGVLVALIVLGAAAIVVGWIHGKARAWAAMTSIVLSGLLLAATLGWTVVSFMGGGVSVMSFLALALACAAIVLSPLSLGPCRRATLAQEKLKDAGLDLGL